MESSEEDVQPGEALYDMHDGYVPMFTDRKGRAWRVIRKSLQVLQTDKGSQIIQEITGEPYTNKTLVALNDGSHEQDIQAAYSYDGLRFGIMTLERLP
jgi:thymidylate synthase